MKRKIKGGLTSVSLGVFIADTSSTTGGGLSGVTSGSSGLVLEYRRAGQSTWTSVTPASGKTLGSFLAWGIVADGSLDGAYEVDFPDAAFASGARFVLCRIRGVANMLPVLIEVELDAVDYQVDAFGALKPTASGRTLDVTANGNAGIDLANVDNPTATLALTNTTISVGQQVASVSGNVGGTVGSVVGNVGGNVNGSVGSVAGNVSGNVNGTVGSVVGNVGGNVAGTVGSVVGNVGGNVVGSVGSLATFGFSVTVSTGSVDAIADQVWDEAYADHTTAGSFGKLMDILRKSNTVVDGTVTSAVTATTTSFSSNVNYLTGAFKHALVLFTSGALSEQNSPILTFTNTNGVLTVEEAFTAAPQAGDTFIIIPTTHVHAVVAIADGVLGRSTSTSNYNAGDVGYVLRQLYSMIESDGSTGWEFTTGSLVNAPSGGGGASDWTANEKTAIRSILGFDASGAIVSLSSGALFAISTQTQNLFKYGDTQVWTSPANQINVTVTKV